MIGRVVIVWFVMWMLTWPALLADIQQDSVFGRCYRVDRYRSHLSEAMGVALLPPLWIITPFVTGFYQHGFQLYPLSDCGGHR